MNHQPLKQKIKPLIIGLFFLTLTFFSAHTANAAVINVSTVADTAANDGDCSLREAVTSADTNAVSGAAGGECPAGGGSDTINLPAGTYNLSSQLPQIDNGNITIIGTSGKATTIIDAQNGSRIFFNASASSLTLQGLTLTNGNVATLGGAIRNNLGATLIIADSTLSSNHNDDVGGAIYNAGTLSIDNTLFDTNDATAAGGAISMNSGSLTISDSVFSTNSSTTGAGVIYLASGGGITTDITNTTFNNNTSAGNGGVIFSNNDVTLNITNSTFTNNTATNLGGAIVADNITNITNSTFYNNTAGNSGGAIYTSGGTNTIINSTFSGNGSPDGGTIKTQVAGNGTTTLKNTIIASPSAGVNCTGDAPIDGGNNLQFPGASCGGTIATANPLLVAIADNGGPTQTMAIPANSPAKDAGDNTICAAAPVSNLDQRGTVRPQETTCDIGAYELNITPTLTETTAVTPVTTTDTTPSYTLESNVTGTLSFPGSCKSATTAITADVPLTINFDNPALADGTYANCTIIVTETGSNEASDPLAVTSFTVDSTAPVLAQVSAVSSPANTLTPTYRFSLTEAGTIAYNGCPAIASPINGANVTASVDKTLTFGTLTNLLTYTNCAITVTDSVGNVSNQLTIPNFAIQLSSGGGVVIFPSSPPPAAEPPVNQPATFTDISDSWAKTEIIKLSTACNVQGFSDANGKLLNLFKPENKITRAELITMIMKCRYGVLPSIVKSSFNDVANTHFAIQYIEKAADLGIIKGYADKSFRPENLASRSEALKMILLTWISLTNINDAKFNNTCVDIAGNEWYYSIFNYALNQKIINGYSVNINGKAVKQCLPLQNITRAETAKIIITTKELVIQ